jgi:hypothetical protein
MTRPFVLAVDDADALTVIAHELRRRYGEDFEVFSHASAGGSAVCARADYRTGWRGGLLLAEVSISE